MRNKFFYNPSNTYKEVVAVVEVAVDAFASYVDAAENYPHVDHDGDSDPLGHPVGDGVAGDGGTGVVGIVAAEAAFVAVDVAVDQIDFERIVDEVATAVVDH